MHIGLGIWRKVSACDCGCDRGFRGHHRQLVSFSSNRTVSNFACNHAFCLAFRPLGTCTKLQQAVRRQFTRWRSVLESTASVAIMLPLPYEHEEPPSESQRSCEHGAPASISPAIHSLALRARINRQPGHSASEHFVCNSLAGTSCSYRRENSAPGVLEPQPNIRPIIRRWRRIRKAAPPPICGNSRSHRIAFEASDGSNDVSLDSIEWSYHTSDSARHSRCP